MSGWRVAGRILAVLIICVFVPLTGTLLLAVNAQHAVVEGGFLVEAFQDSRPFELALEEAARDLAISLAADPDTRDLPIARLDKQDWQTVLQALAPASSLRDLAREYARGLREWIRFGGDQPEELILPFGSIRQALVEDPDQTVLRTITEAQPACEPGQEPLAGLTPLVPSCRPDEAEREAFYNEAGLLWAQNSEALWEQLWPAEIARYPDNTALGEYMRQQGGVSALELRSGWRWARWGLGFAGGVVQFLVVAQAVLLLGLVAILAARSWAEVLRWVGAALALAGLFTAGLGLIALVGSSFGPLVSVPVQSAWIDLDTLTGGVAQAFGRDLWGGMSFQGGVLTLIGLVLWLSALFILGRTPAGMATVAGGQSDGGTAAAPPAA